ncbi:hypothetical protein RCL1_004552 [Eukaryota sp. TZLM3-RCL]
MSRSSSPLSVDFNASSSFSHSRSDSFRNSSDHRTVQALKRELKAATEKLRVLEHERLADDAFRRKSFESLREFSVSVKDVVQENSFLRQRIAELESVNSPRPLRSSCEDCLKTKQELAASKTALIKVNANNLTLTEQLNVTSEHTNTLKTEVKALKLKLEESEDTIATLVEKLRNQENSINLLQNERSNYVENNHNYDSQIRNLELFLIEKDEIIKSLEEQHLELQEHVESLNQSLLQIKQSFDQSNSRVSELSNLIDSLETEREELIAEHQIELESLQNELLRHQELIMKAQNSERKALTKLAKLEVLFMSKSHNSLRAREKVASLMREISSPRRTPEVSSPLTTRYDVPSPISTPISISCSLVEETKREVASSPAITSPIKSNLIESRDGDHSELVNEAKDNIEESKLIVDVVNDVEESKIDNFEPPFAPQISNLKIPNLNLEVVESSSDDEAVSIVSFSEEDSVEFYCEDQPLPDDGDVAVDDVTSEVKEHEITENLQLEDVTVSHDLDEINQNLVEIIEQDHLIDENTQEETEQKHDEEEPVKEEVQLLEESEVESEFEGQVTELTNQEVVDNQQKEINQSNLIVDDDVLSSPSDDNLSSSEDEAIPSHNLVFNSENLNDLLSDEELDVEIFDQNVEISEVEQVHESNDIIEDQKSLEVLPELIENFMVENNSAVDNSEETKSEQEEANISAEKFVLPILADDDVEPINFSDDLFFFDPRKQSKVGQSESEVVDASTSPLRPELTTEVSNQNLSENINVEVSDLEPPSQHRLSTVLSQNILLNTQNEIQEHSNLIEVFDDSEIIPKVKESRDDVISPNISDLVYDDVGELIVVSSEPTAVQSNLIENVDDNEIINQEVDIEDVLSSLSDDTSLHIQSVPGNSKKQLLLNSACCAFEFGKNFGFEMLKIPFNGGSPAKRFVFFDDKCIFWSKVNKKRSPGSPPKSVVKFSEIESILIGPCTPTCCKFLTDSKIDIHLSISIVVEDRTVDFIAKSIRDAINFVWGLSLMAPENSYLPRILQGQLLWKFVNLKIKYIAMRKRVDAKTVLLRAIRK